MDCPTFLFLRVTVSFLFPSLIFTLLRSLRSLGPSLARVVLACVPSVHDYESFLLIRFIEPLHQTGATDSLRTAALLDRLFSTAFASILRATARREVDGVDG